IRARAFLARLDLKADALPTRQGVEVHARVESGAVEEILTPVLCGNEPEPAVGYKLLDSACRHLQLLFSKENLANARSFREESTTAANIVRLPDDEITLPRVRRPQTGRSDGDQSDSDDGRNGPRQLQRSGPALAAPPSAPPRHGDDGALPNGGDDRQRRDAEGDQNEQVAGPHEDADHSALPPADRSRR